MKKMSFTRYGESVLNYLAVEYDCEGELDHTDDGVGIAREFIKNCYENDDTVQNCCGELVRQVIRKNSKAA
jgi:hypothetical protein